MSVSETLKTLAATGVDTAFDLGVLPDRQTLTVSGQTATFAVANHKEWLRARSAMGETDVLRWVLEHIDAETTVWDVGAAVGTYATHAAVAGADVVAFEPVQANAARTRQNARLNDVSDAITVHDCALGASARETSMVVIGDGPGEGVHRIAGHGTVPVSVRRGDSITPSPDVLKVDVEGAEHAVLDGMEAHLSGVNAAVVEVHSQHGITPQMIIDRLEAAGLEAQIFGDRNSHLVDGEQYVVATRS